MEGPAPNWISLLPLPAFNQTSDALKAVFPFAFREEQNGHELAMTSKFLCCGLEIRERGIKKDRQVKAIIEMNVGID